LSVRIEQEPEVIKAREDHHKYIIRHPFSNEDKLTELLYVLDDAKKAVENKLIKQNENREIDLIREFEIYQQLNK
jgi:hypothetical protein